MSRDVLEKKGAYEGDYARSPCVKRGKKRERSPNPLESRISGKGGTNDGGAWGGKFWKRRLYYGYEKGW